MARSSLPRYDFIISRRRYDPADTMPEDAANAYAVWRFDPGSPELLSPVPVDPSARLDRRHSLAQIGNYLLEWGPITQQDYQPYFPYRLFMFDPTNRRPLDVDAKTTVSMSYGPQVVSTAVQKGLWPKSKFWAYRPDFGNHPVADVRAALVVAAVPPRGRVDQHHAVRRRRGDAGVGGDAGAGHDIGDVVRGLLVSDVEQGANSVPDQQDRGHPGHGPNRDDEGKARHQQRQRSQPQWHRGDGGKCVGAVIAGIMVASQRHALDQHGHVADHKQLRDIENDT